jgi:hypothetical protein
VRGRPVRWHHLKQFTEFTSFKRNARTSQQAPKNTGQKKKLYNFHGCITSPLKISAYTANETFNIKGTKNTPWQLKLLHSVKKEPLHDNELCLAPAPIACAIYAAPFQ